MTSPLACLIPLDVHHMKSSSRVSYPFHRHYSVVIALGNDWVYDRLQSTTNLLPGWSLMTQLASCSKIHTAPLKGLRAHNKTRNGWPILKSAKASRKAALHPVLSRSRRVAKSGGIQVEPRVYIAGTQTRQSSNQYTYHQAPPSFPQTQCTGHPICLDGAVRDPRLQQRPQDWRDIY